MEDIQFRELTELNRAIMIHLDKLETVLRPKNFLERWLPDIVKTLVPLLVALAVFYSQFQSVAKDVADLKPKVQEVETMVRGNDKKIDVNQKDVDALEGRVDALEGRRSNR